MVILCKKILDHHTDIQMNDTIRSECRLAEPHKHLRKLYEEDTSRTERHQKTIWR